MYKFIIVDDETIIRKGTLLKIKKTNLNLEYCGEAGNGEEALELIKKTHPDIIIMDMRMPIMDGRMLLNELKKLFPNIKIIVMSGYSDYEYMRDAISAQVVDYILKPFNVAEIAEILSNIITALEQDTSDISDWNDFNNLLSNVFDGNSLQVLDYINRFYDFLRSQPEMDIHKFNSKCLFLFRRVVKNINTHLEDCYKQKILEIAEFDLNDSSINDTIDTITSKILSVCRVVSQSCNESSEHIVYNVQKYIANNYSMNISLEQIAVAFSISPNYFSFLFKKVTGQSYIDFVNGVRIQKAKELLLNTNYKIHEIAKSLGFNNTKYFFRVFKKLEESTPSEFRNGKI